MTPSTRNLIISSAVSLVVGAVAILLLYPRVFPCPGQDISKELELQRLVYELTAERDMAVAKADELSKQADSIVYIRDTKTIKQYEKRLTDASLDSLQSILLSEPNP